jgi:hypothetical protein
MTKALTTLTKTTVHSTRARSAVKKKNHAAADNLQKIVAAEKKVCEEKKKKRADEKKAEEEKKKKSDEEKAQAKVTADQEKAKASSATISPPNPNIALEDGATRDDDWTEDKYDRCLQTHGISPNHLFAKDATDIPEKLTETLDLTGGNSPFKENSRNTRSSQKSNTRYSTSAFSLTQKVHVHTYTKTFIEAAITLKSEDKPKEFIAAIKLLLANGKYLDSNLALTPLKHNINITKPKLILREDDIPVNFTHLGQYVYTSGKRIFEKKKNWKAAPNKTAPQ